MRAIFRAERCIGPDGQAQQGDLEKELMQHLDVIYFSTVFQIPEQEDLPLTDGVGFRVMGRGEEISLSGTPSRVMEFFPALNLQDMATNRFMVSHGAELCQADKSRHFLLALTRSSRSPPQDDGFSPYQQTIGLPQCALGGIGSMLSKQSYNIGVDPALARHDTLSEQSYNSNEFLESGVLSASSSSSSYAPLHPPASCTTASPSLSYMSILILEFSIQR
ncbi:hypothetical protein AAF712_013511 [Marasmius tenuissimus]|uniref:Uncharacterized protein n=1 Tax=Marasmius tenuissimus TaxID=585030 RepID=A0ABR2ZDF9_9AGAR